MNPAANAAFTAPLALLLAVPLTLVLFSSFPPARAAFLSLLIGTLVLPVDYGWMLPGVTFLDKATIPLLTSIVACAALAPREFRHLRLRGPTLYFALAFVVGSFMTAFTNAQAYAVGGLVLSPLTAYDGIGIFRELAFQLLFPYLLGRMLVRDVRQIEPILMSFATAMLIYSLPMLFEIRMSPQLHTEVYGYFPHSFFQQAREGGFRPVVFVGHGLPLAIITSFGLLASSMLWRRGRKIQGLPAAVVTSYLGGVVFLCKTFAAMVYAGAGTAAMFFCSPKTLLRISMVIACIVLAYPVLRTFDYFPTKMLTDLSGSANKDRSDSLAFRFDNEDRLLAHARERWLFGWGGYGRNRVFNEEGNDTTVTDGLWIILFGQVGAWGFLTAFGLMTLPIFRCGRALQHLRSKSERQLLASLALLVALNWADSLPNALSGGVLMVFLTGAFAGVVDSNQVARRRPAAIARPPVDLAAAG